jgi:hypothetical protein
MSIFLDNIFPENNSLYANPRCNVRFSIADSANTTIDFTSLNVKFGNLYPPTQYVILNGQPQDGYNVSIIREGIVGNDGYTINFSPSLIYQNALMHVEVSADTIPSSGVQTFTWSFRTATHVGYYATSIQNMAYGTLETSSTTGIEYLGYTFSGRNGNVLFQLNDKNEPVITNRIPIVNSVDNLRETDINFALHDT